MKKYIVVLLTVGILAAVLAIPAQASVGFCADRALPSEKALCAASITEDKVAFASVRVNRIGKARWRLTCEKGNHEFTASGRVRGNIRQVARIRLPQEQFFQEPECRLSAVARGTRRLSVRGYAKARVVLTLLSAP